ncbi:unnamed protein product [Schistosoma curassoni]|uniref:Myb_DNA-bind_5 domain-containing protein n=1 Tax=Schistosoma curassoni TaxID=6186 RepID=A0A183KNJ5_9TREM|nr:unnamed protein product [Schistosoma curassoni]
MESNWKRIEEAITSKCHEVLGQKKHHHKEWITVDTLNKIQEKRNTKAAINTSLTRAEKAKAQAEYTEKLSGNRRKPERPEKSKEGKVITNIEEQQNGWVEHFKELLNRPAPLNPPNIETAPTDLPINVTPPTIEEISMAISQIKSSKAAGPDNIPAEALKVDVATSTSEGQHGIQWTSSMQLDDLDFADNLALLSKSQQQMQEKTISLAAV